MRVKQSSKATLSIYFPELSSQQLLTIGSLAEDQCKLSSSDLPGDWQQEFCQEIGFSQKNIPWNKLRALQFDVPSDTQTAVCCDPVMMQMTHRGAYLWGQQQLEFSKEDVVRIIAQINQQLMSDDECFYLLDNNQWLYTNKKLIELEQASFEQYIGKDMFGFSYFGKDGVFWDKLATEIQMLIKQMMDYQGLAQVPAEMIVNVHFWGNTDNKLSQPFEQIDSKDLSITLSDELLILFCEQSGLQITSLDNYEDILLELKDDATSNNLLVISNNQSTDIEKLIEDCFESSNKDFSLVRFITQDKILTISTNKNLWQRMVKYFE